MLPGAIFSGIDGSRQYETGEPGARSERNQQRYARFSEGLRRAAAYKEKKAAENEADKEDDDETKTDTVGPKGFKIGNDATVVTGYRDPGFKLAGVQGRSLLGPIGAGVGIFNPALGKGISAVGSLTGL